MVKKQSGKIADLKINFNDKIKLIKTMAKQNTISGIVIAFNEAEFLPNCLKSLKWVDELMLIDANSTDSTRSIAEQAGARIISSPWQGFPQQRNLAAQAAKCEWLLYVDADERVSTELKKEIQDLLQNQKQIFKSYKIPHKNIILGKWLKHGGWYPEYQYRLMKRKSLKGWQGELHEHPVVEGSVGYLKADLIHLTHRGLQWMLEKTIRYTRMEAELRIKAGHPKIRIYHLFSAPLREFCYRCLKKSGWQDGIAGWIEILYQAFNQFLVMVWLWELQKKQTMKEIYQEIDRKLTDEL